MGLGGFKANSFDADTDGDGISDDDEVGVYFPDYRESGYHFLYSDPTSADTDGDGLGDYEETQEDYEIVYTDSPDATRNFFGALQTDEQDPVDYLTSRTPGSSAMQADSDDDGLSDREEVSLGTDAKSRDTDGDGIPDGEEDALGGDPTLFDAQPPRVRVWYANFHKPAWSLKTEYTLSFTASDESGVRRVAVVKDDEPRFEDYNSDYPDAASYGYVQFKTGIGETILDGLLGATVQVEAEDRHGNEQSMTALERTNLYGHVAGELGSDTIYGLAIAHDLGKLSGFTVGAGESIESIQTLIEDPVAFVESLTQIVELLDQLGLLDDLIAMMPAQIDRKQEVTNPYDEASQPDLYQSYRVGWYGGYASYFIVSIIAGAQVTKVIKGTKSFAKLVDTLDRDGKLTDAIQYYQKAKGTATAPVRKAGYLLARGGHEVAKPILRGAKTTGQAYKRWRMYRRVTDGDLCSSSLKDCGVDLSHLSRDDRTALGKLMGRYRDGDRFEALVKGLDESEREALARFVRENGKAEHDLLVLLGDDAARTLFSYPDSSALSKVIDDPNYLPRWRNNLADLEGKTVNGRTIYPNDINRYLANLEEVEVHRINSDPNKVKRTLIGEVKDANGPENFFGSANEVERIAYYSKRADSVDIEPDEAARIDLGVNYGTRTEYIELKNANEKLTGSKIENYIENSQKKFTKANDIEFKEGDDKVLEISARDGVDGKLGEDGIEQAIEKHVSEKLQSGEDIQLTEIRVHLSKDTDSITCSITNTGVEC